MPGDINGGQHLYLLALASWRERLRWVSTHLYSVLFLGPLILGMTYLTLGNLAESDLPLVPTSGWRQLLLASSVFAALVIAGLSRSSRELYHLKRPSFFAEALALKPSVHLHLSLLTRVTSVAWLCLVLLLLRTLFAGDSSLRLSKLSELLSFGGLMTLSQVYAALVWVHWGHRREQRAAALSIVLLFINTIAGASWLLSFFHPAGTSIFFQSGWRWSLFAVTGLLAGLTYFIAHRSHERWRAEDMDYAQRMDAGNRTAERALTAIGRVLPAEVRELILRDLRLSLRIFSSAVYLVAGLTLLLVLLLAIVIRGHLLPVSPGLSAELSGTDWLGATWLPAALALKVSIVLVVLTLSALVPLLIAYQLPFMWLERSTGVTGRQLWEAKVWYARLITLPAAGLTVVAGMVMAELGRSSALLPLVYVAPLLAECFWLWWLVSTAVGALAFEIPDRAGLALVLMATTALAVGLFGVMLWPAGVALYGLGIAHIRERGIQRAAFLLTEEAT